MAKVDLFARPTDIAKLSHKVVLCTQDDVLQEDNQLRLVRKGLRPLRAQIQEKRVQTFTSEGERLSPDRGQRHVPTHVLTVRYSPSLVISNMAWAFEQRRKSPDRWFKITNIGQSEGFGRSQYFRFDCVLVERSDTATKPEAFNIVKDEGLDL